jgi:hypothetical protein
MTDIERQHLEAPPPRPSQPPPCRPPGRVSLRCMEKTADRRFPASRRSSRRCATRSGTRRGEHEVTARGAPSTSRSGSPTAPTPRATRCWTTRRDPRRAGAGLRGAGMTLPLQTGSAIIGARVLSADAARRRGAARRSVALAKRWPTSSAAARSAHAACTSTSSCTSTRPSSRTPRGARRQGDRRRRLLSTTDWAPHGSVDGVHLTDAARR